MRREYFIWPKTMATTICMGVIILLLIALIGYHIYDFMGRPYQIEEIEERYQLFIDLLAIILTISGIAIAALGYGVYRYISERLVKSIDDKLDNREKELIAYSTGLVFLNLGFSSWLNYKDTRDKSQLETAIRLTELAYNDAKRLDETEQKYELLKCQIMNNLGYYLATRRLEGDREFAKKCGNFILGRLDKYPEKRVKWQDTYDYILEKYVQEQELG